MFSNSRAYSGLKDSRTPCTTISPPRDCRRVSNSLWFILKTFTATGLLAFFSLTACSSHKQQLEPAWSYAPGGIHLVYQSDSLLNSYDSKPHALLCLVYQLKSINGFKKLTASRDGLLHLLEGESFDSSVMGVGRLFIQPGHKDTVKLSRVENAKWVGIVAGYNDLDPKKSTKFYEIPVRIKSKGIPLFKKHEAEIEVLTLDLVFSSNSIQETTSPSEKKH